jgi:hypothetical protein
LLDGSGNVQLRQNCVYVNAVYKVNGLGNLPAVQISIVDVDVNGSGNIDVYCTQKLKARIQGSGDINYWGNPVNVDLNISGSGRIRKKQASVSNKTSPVIIYRVLFLCNMHFLSIKHCCVTHFN